jgi:signal transduction histidine kinase/DNA-binding response OmpR family regulator
MQNQYMYRLRGVDKDWIRAGNKTFASFTHLSPGNYIFEVKGSNNDGVWSTTPAAIRISVHPPFWMTYYAYLLYLAATLSFLFYLRHRGIKDLKSRFAVEQTKREAKQLHELDQMKIKFLTNISHEFRTPISLILAPADRLISDYDEAGISRQALIIKRNATRLLNLVNQLLDLRQLEEKELSLNLSSLEMVAFIKEIKESFQEVATKKNIHYTFHSEVELLSGVFDADKLERILFNILSNAFKFTPNGGTIACGLHTYLRPDTDDKQWVSIQVADTGAGISDENRERIFDRFFQDKGNDTVLNQGSGIGLSIAREFVHLHEGKISVESRLGSGSTFRIDLPLRSATILSSEANGTGTSEMQRSPVVSNLPERLQPLSGSKVSRKKNTGKGSQLPTVLVVEDSDEFRLQLKEALETHYWVIEAVNGQEGWHKALSSHPDLIISDIAMPLMDGIALGKKLKGDKRTSQIPLILLTASASETSHISGLNSGANDYLTKPFNFEILHAKIRNQLKYNHVLRSTFTKQFHIVPGEIIVESKNEKLLNTIVRYVEDNIANPQLSVEDLSRHIGMSRGSLYNKLLELTGKTPIDFIRSIKLDKAASLMENSELNIAQIAYLVGFTAPNYFTKAFKAKFHMLPKEYALLKRGGRINRMDNDLPEPC